MSLYVPWQVPFVLFAIPATLTLFGRNLVDANPSINICDAFVGPFHANVYNMRDNLCYYVEVANTTFPVLWDPFTDIMFGPATISIYIMGYMARALLFFMEVAKFLLEVFLEFFLPSL